MKSKDELIDDLQIENILLKAKLRNYSNPEIECTHHVTIIRDQDPLAKWMIQSEYGGVIKCQSCGIEVEPRWFAKNI